MSDETTPADPTPAADPAAPAPTEPAPAAPTEPAEPAKPAEGEEPPAAAAETPEIAKARKILAAASKRAERALERENRAKALEARAKEYDDLRSEVQRNPAALLRLGGYPDVKTYLKALVDSPGDDAAPTEAKRLDAIEARFKQEDEAAAADARAERIESAQKKVFEAIDASPKHDRATGALGHQMIWGEIEAYYKLHGDVPDQIVWMIADKVEKYLSDEGMGPRKKPEPAKPPSALTNGMTRTSAPQPDGDDGLPMDGKARMAAILARYGKPSAPVS